MYNNNKQLVKFSGVLGKILLMIPAPIKMVLGLLISGLGALIFYDLFIGNNDFGDARGTWSLILVAVVFLLVGLLITFASLAGMYQDAKLKKLERELDRE